MQVVGHLEGGDGLDPGQTHVFTCFVKNIATGESRKVLLVLLSFTYSIVFVL